MDIAFIMGMIAGFFMGVGFSLFFTHMLAYKMLSLLDRKVPKKDEDADDDPVNFWKPKGWRPDES